LTPYIRAALQNPIPPKRTASNARKKFSSDWGLILRFRRDGEFCPEPADTKTGLKHGLGQGLVHELGHGLRAVEEGPYALITAQEGNGSIWCD